MGRNARKRISYVLPLANSAGGHRLGVNGLAVDPYNSILYSGGRDGVICAWDTNLDLAPPDHKEWHGSLDDASSKPAAPPTVFRQQVQAHTHWINDIALAQNNEALVSASSDLSVKVWRPAAQDVIPPQTLGLHSDYVKCLASPSPYANWVASGGLDRKINLWDLNGAGKKMEIVVGDEGGLAAKGSVYALAATDFIVAGGGPESVVRLWDSRSGKRITKFVGHTDNIRDILIADEGDTIMTASSDQTVKVWSLIAGRCMYTLTMHNDSVWSLYSDHPQLSVFYSSDRSGLVAKTDVRGCIEMDEGLSVAVCHEHGGVTKVVGAGEHVWTATSSSSINRWKDVNTEADVQPPDWKHHRMSTATSRTARLPSPTQPGSPPPPIGAQKEQIPRNALLRVSNAASFHLFHNREETSTLHSSAISMRKPSEVLGEGTANNIVPIRHSPEHTIEGQHGLIKHVMLNDRRRVLTLDTAGEAMLWDLIQCVPIKSFGKRHLEDVLPEVNTMETVAHWCAVDTRTGSLTCVLEEKHCFDAEMYADELQLEEPVEFRDDQRNTYLFAKLAVTDEHQPVNLGKWILRYLFANLIDEEIKRDEEFRQGLFQEKSSSVQRNNAPNNIQIPQIEMNGWKEGSAPPSASTIRPPNGAHLPATTPGLAIGVATPSGMPPGSSAQFNTLPTTVEEGGQLEKTNTQLSRERGSLEKGDYFSTNPPPPSTANGQQDDGPLNSPSEPEKVKDKDASFGRKFKMSFGMRKHSRTQITEAAANKPAAVDETPEDSDSRSSRTEDRVVEDNLLGVIQKLRHRYEDEVAEGARSLTSSLTPSLANETPVLKPPPSTTILIQEDRPDSGGVADLFEGTVASLGQQASLIERVAPMWLGETLLRNNPPLKDIVKVSFVLEPWEGGLPAIAHDGNNRLNANRMLRARKIMAYVAERIEPLPETPEPDAPKPEEYLELLCNGQLIPPTMTLATMRAHVWRGAGDVLLLYRANGRKEIRPAKPPTPEPPEGAGSAAAAAAFAANVAASAGASADTGAGAEGEGA